jgi:hypothetical protein
VIFRFNNGQGAVVPLDLPHPSTDSITCRLNV